MTDPSESGCIQIVTHIRRKRDLTPEQFYNHWGNVHAPKVVPWAEKHGIRRYQQIHVSGCMVPVNAVASAPNAISKGDLPTTPVEFDGIALFLVPSLEHFTNAFKDPYFTQVIEPDEREFLDKDGPGSGIVASFQGKMLEILRKPQSTIEDEGSKYRNLYEEFEKRTNM